MGNAYIISGQGPAGPWSANCSGLGRNDSDLWEHARFMGVCEPLLSRGLASRIPGAPALTLHNDAWIVVGQADWAELDRDPAVLAYCEAP